MLRGIEKQVVVLKNTDSDFFEQAIFILKNNNSYTKKDLLEECKKIINRNTITNSKNKSNERSTKVLLIIVLVFLTVFSTLLLLNLM